MQIAAGIPLVTVSARAGHARTSTTTDIYAHFIKSSDKTAAEVIDKVFNPETPQEAQPKPETFIIAAPKENQTDVETTDGGESVEYFKWAKSEMKRLGFETIEELEEYRDFMERKKQNRSQRKSDYSM